jgi:hypothetical protein
VLSLDIEVEDKPGLISGYFEENAKILKLDTYNLTNTLKS